MQKNNLICIIVNKTYFLSIKYIELSFDPWGYLHIENKSNGLHHLFGAELCFGVTSLFLPLFSDVPPLSLLQLSHLLLKSLFQAIMFSTSCYSLQNTIFPPAIAVCVEHFITPHSTLTESEIKMFCTDMGVKLN